MHILATARQLGAMMGAVSYRKLPLRAVRVPGSDACRELLLISGVKHTSGQVMGVTAFLFFLQQTGRCEVDQMRAVEAGARVTLNNILFLTDFSEPSETAIPYAIATAREYKSKVHTLHVLTPVRLSHVTPESDAALVDSLEERAQVEMQRIDSLFVGVAHETLIVRGESVWSSVEKILIDREIDLVIVGTHGRTGAIKLLLGPSRKKSSEARAFRY